jgi:acyl-coenzyme A synthetase/AMP-(fatty) acid ligase
MYGPTETTVWSTCWRVEDPAKGILIGRPIANTHIYILDRHMEPVTVGVTGDLYIGGLGVTKGYLNREELTAERFVTDPFREGSRMYRTGDLGRLRHDGSIECLGRTDNQVKIRGFRIELGEIEAVLMDHEGVRQAVVVVQEERQGDQRLVAFVILDPQEEPTPTELRRHLRTRLPEHMVPPHYVQLDEFPLTPSGKVDRNALTKLSSLGSEARSDAEPPRGKTEQLVAEIWKDILGTHEISAHDNFFNLGGHSLLALRALGRIAASTGRTIPPRSMVLQSLRQIAAEIDRMPA